MAGAPGGAADSGKNGGEQRPIRNEADAFAEFNRILGDRIDKRIAAQRPAANAPGAVPGAPGVGPAGAGPAGAGPAGAIAPGAPGAAAPPGAAAK